MATIARRVVKIRDGTGNRAPALGGPVAPGPPDQEHPLGLPIAGDVGQHGGRDVPFRRSDKRTRGQGDRETRRGGEGRGEWDEGAVAIGVYLPGGEGGGAGQQGQDGNDGCGRNA